MKSKKLIDKKPTCAGMIKLVLKDYDWLSKEELKEQVDKINKKYTGIETVREDTFTKSINDLLNKKEIALRKTLESENPLEYNPSKDCKKYYFKLTSNFSYKLSPEIKTAELINLLKKGYTELLFKENNIKNIENHNTNKLYIEIEAYDIFNKKERTEFLVDIYKCDSPNDANKYFKELSKFSMTSSYYDKTDRFKENSIYPGNPQKCYYFFQPIKTDFQFKSFSVKLDDIPYINNKNYWNTFGFVKTLFLVYNLVIVIYDFRLSTEEVSGVSGTAIIFNYIQNYLLSQ